MIMEMEVGRCLSQAGGQSVGRNAFSHMCMAIAAVPSSCPSCRSLWREARILSALCPEYSNQIPPRRPHAARSPSSVLPRSSLALVELLLGGLFKAARNCRPRSVMPSSMRGCWLGLLGPPRWCSEAYGMALTWPAIRDKAPSLHSSSPFLFLFFVIREGRLDASEANDMWRAEQSRKAGRKERKREIE